MMAEIIQTPDALAASSRMVTILRHSRNLMCKTWQPDGTIKPYDEAKYFTVIEEEVEGIEGLSRLLSRLENDRHACLIRGAYVGEENAAKIDAQHKPGLARRVLDLFEDTPRHWVLIEVDNFVPQSADPVLDPVKAINEYIGARLPLEFQGADYHWQLSNSAGSAKNAGKLKAHVWFWLEKPYSSAQLRSWATDMNIDTDKSVLQPVQIHYTAAPVFDGIANPVPVRSGFEVGMSAYAVALDIRAHAPLATSAKPTAKQRLADIQSADPIAVFLNERGMVKSVSRDGEQLNIICPREAEHTTESSENSTVYRLPHTGGFEKGNFICQHDHCKDDSGKPLPRELFIEALGYVDEELLTEFVAIADAGGDAPAAISAPEAVPERFKFKVENAFDFSQRPAPSWIIKGVLPQGELGVLFGESGSGKSFFALDMGVAIAQGDPWRGLKTRAGRVVYVAAEGAGGFRNRLKAYAHQHNLDLLDLNIGIIAGAPNLKDKADALDIAKSIQASGGADLVIIDTFAQTMPGSNENSGEDVGQALAHCKGISRALRGAMVLLVHHSGKDSSKGARGWSGLRAAADVEIEISRCDEARVATISKQKDGQDGGEFGFALQTVVVDFDEDGDEITSCVLEHTGTTSRDVRRDKGPKGGIEKLVLEHLNDLIGVGDPTVALSDLKAAVINQMPFDDAEGKRDTRNQRVMRALESLRDAGRIEVQGLNISMANAQ